MKSHFSAIRVIVFFVAIVSIAAAYVILRGNHGNESKSDDAEMWISGYEEEHPWVDLGLSVKWATCNVGAHLPGDVGNYYAWGETQRKEIYNWRTLNFRSDVMSIKGENDPATVNWGEPWRTPTHTEFEELLEGCTWEWGTFGLSQGYYVTSKSNGNSIFLPAAGHMIGRGNRFIGTNGSYCASTLLTHYLFLSEEDKRFAEMLYFAEDFTKNSISERCDGLTVRPVADYR